MAEEVMEELFGADSDPEEEANGEKEAAADDMEELFGADSDDQDQEGEEDGRGPPPHQVYQAFVNCASCLQGFFLFKTSISSLHISMSDASTP